MALLLSMLIPPPPPPIVRETPVTTHYAANCRLTARNGSDHQIFVEVRTHGSQRSMTFNTKSTALAPLAVSALTAYSMSYLPGGARWFATDYARGALGEQKVSITLAFYDDLADGASISIDAVEGWQLPLYLGLCRAKVLEQGRSS